MTFGHITQFSGAYYNTQHTSNYSYDNTNRSPYWSYDAEGNITIDDEASYTVDAAGRLVRTSQFDPDSGLPMAPTRDWFDGNGRLAKRVKNFGSSDPAPQTNYYLRSSVTDDPGKNQRILTYLITIIHESIHREGISGHNSYAKASYNALTTDEATLNPLPKKKDRERGESMDDARSRYFRSIINTKCKIDPYSVNW
ncbi:MAG: hypothetical protein IPN69_15165 [Acidobacteria bacterium]|nr:hypothetical protein [Acidobacteriota bacterium]